MPKILYVIHTSPKRIDFVKKYMIPCFKRYGIENIKVWNDVEMIGQLRAWTDCARWIISEKSDYEGTWHLEDDVIPCKDFKALSETLPQTADIIQGFITENKLFDFNGKTGVTSVKDLPYGTQCIYIPNRFLQGFVKFFDEVVSTGDYRARQFNCGTLYADNVFRGYMRRYHNDVTVNNLDSCMVEHIDYLIGGRSVKKQVLHDTKARKFDNYYEVVRLKVWTDFIREAENGKTENRD